MIIVRFGQTNFYSLLCFVGFTIEVATFEQTFRKAFNFLKKS